MARVGEDSGHCAGCHFGPVITMAVITVYTMWLVDAAFKVILWLKLM